MIKLVLLVIAVISVIHAQTTSDCGKAYGCFRYPSGCEDAKCDFIYKWKVNANPNSIDFVIAGKVPSGQTNRWIAIGFSNDIKMGEDSVVLCKSPAKTIQSYYNAANGPELADSTKPLLGITNVNVNETNGYLICSFTRDKQVTPVNAKYFDLNNKYYPLAAMGNYTTAAGNPDVLNKHLAQVAGTEKVLFSSSRIDTENYPLNFGCPAGYTCFKSPSTCDDKTCSFAYKWKDNNDYVDFEIAARLKTFDNKWLAIGFSKDATMGDDSLVVCKTNKDVQSYFNPYNYTEFIDSNRKELGLSHMKVIENNEFLICFFSRNKTVSPKNSKYFELGNKYYLVGAFGDYNAATPEILKVHSNATKSDNELEFGNGSMSSLISGGSWKLLLLIALAFLLN